MITDLKIDEYGYVVDKAAREREMDRMIIACINNASKESLASFKQMLDDKITRFEAENSPKKPVEKKTARDDFVPGRRATCRPWM